MSDPKNPKKRRHLITPPRNGIPLREYSPEQPKPRQRACVEHVATNDIKPETAIIPVPVAESVPVAETAPVAVIAPMAETIPVAESVLVVKPYKMCFSVHNLTFKLLTKTSTVEIKFELCQYESKDENLINLIKLFAEILSDPYIKKTKTIKLFENLFKEISFENFVRKYVDVKEGSYEFISLNASDFNLQIFNNDGSISFETKISTVVYDTEYIRILLLFVVLINSKIFISSSETTN